METVFVVTREENDYNQYGQYFVAVFKNKPTVEELTNIPQHYISEESAKLILKGQDGRVGYADTWYGLIEATLL